MGMQRRTWLLAALAMAGRPAWGATPAPVSDRLGARRLHLRHEATGARFGGPYHNGLVPDPGALAEISAVLADHHTGAIRGFDPAALDVLWLVTRRAGLAGEVAILSGYRTPATNALVDGAGDSQHLRAAAVDVMLPTARFASVLDAAMLLGRGGVGSYPRRGFVHLDSGPPRHWGEASALRQAPRSDPLAQMAEAWAATRGRLPPP
jgi:uncharacterized protein YcbK (DUF882 family)